MTHQDTGVWLFVKREGYQGKAHQIDRFRNALETFERLKTDLSVERLRLYFDGEEVGWYTRNACLQCDGRGKVERWNRNGNIFDGWHDCASCSGTGTAARLGTVRAA